ncbi:MAG: carbohydrate-binding family V/XII [Bacteroidetes bacterium]|nr:carbohydrate-binding family V/XII [Bacteroidota bacterium]
MKRFSIFIMSACLSLMVVAQSKQTPANWPKQINTTNGKILVYQPQPDSLIGIKLYGRAAVSYTKTGQQPTFGAIWFMTTIAVDRTNREVGMSSVKILNVRFPSQDQSNTDKIEKFKNTLETEIPKWNLDMTMDELNASLADAKAVNRQASGLNNVPPEIIFTKTPSVLVLFDGDPKFKPVPNSKIQQAVNTPFFVVQDPGNKEYYLYGSTWWYKTNDVDKGKWVNVKAPPGDIKKLQESLAAQANANPDNNQKAASADDNSKDKTPPASPPQIIVRTAPAELVQSNGEPDFSPIQGTQLLYMTNSENNIFMFIDKQMYYVLISGRWYTSSAMAGPWTFIASDKLPADFANIPEGSDKDQVLASVAGTEAAKEAVLDAQIPQTAAVDRKTATCKVTYDGDPKFVQIKGTLLYRAANTSSTVIMADKSYYVCDNAVWFVGNAPTGPWVVAVEIPADIQNIPPEDPVYNVKYVYIYESTPDVVYVGYLPGYTGCYIYGPTVVYGTGFYYNPWYGPYYYPRPVTFGFSMNYNPWTGWSFGWGMSVGFMSVGFYGPHPGGWWGPPMFHPPFCPPYNHFYGPRPPMYRNTSVNVNVNNNYNRNNVYNNHQSGVRPGTWTNPKTGTMPADRGKPSTQPAGRPGQGQVNDKARPSSQPSGQPVNRAGTAPNSKNNVYTDKNGDVYRKGQNSNWQKNDGKNWQNVDQGSGRSSMDKQSQNRDRGQQMNQNAGSFQRNSGGGGGGNRPPSGGGGGRGGRR